MSLCITIIFLLLTVCILQTAANPFKRGKGKVEATSATSTLSLSKKKKRTSTSTKIEDRNSKRYLLPRLLPHKDEAFLLEFVSDGSDHCDQMEIVVKRLEDGMYANTKLLKISMNFIL